jgi:uncharacterized membrane protein YraQ (UPF0718 family)
MARLKRLIDEQLLFMLAVLLLLGAVAWWRGGEAMVSEGFRNGLALVARVGLIVLVSLLVAGVAEVLVPRSWIEAAMGDAAGMRGVAIGVVAGAMTPAGPYVAMPIAAILMRSGAGTGPVVAFVASWSLLAVHRLFAWEIPLMGVRFAALRFGLCLLLPLLVGWLASQFGGRVRAP